MKRFRSFIESEKQLVIFNLVLMIALYGFRLFNWTIGRDTDLYVKYGYYKYQPWGETGKVGLVILKKIFDIFEFNIYFYNIVSFILLLLGTLAWCYFLYYFSGKENKMAMMFFSGFYISSGVIVEHFSFTLQNIELFLAMMFVPMVIIILFYGLRNNKKSVVMLTVIMMSFLILIYQAILLMICAGIIIAFVLVNSNEKKTINISIRNQIVFIFAAIVSSTLIYFIVSKLAILLYFKKTSSYLTDKVTIYNSFSEFAKQMILYIYMLIFGNSKIASKIIDPYLASKASGGEATVRSLHTFFNGTASLLFLIIPILFFIILIKRKPRRISVVVSLLLIPCMLFFFIIGSGQGGMRVHMALPIALGFMIWYIVCYCKSIIFRRIMIIVLMCALAIQINRGIQCFTTDYEVFNQDVHICNSIDDEIHRRTSEECKVIIIGKHAERLNAGMRNTFILGNSVFNWGEMGEGGMTIRSTAFMNGLGIKYEPLLDTKLIKECKIVSQKMPSYPSDGYVKIYKKIAIVKLSN